MNNFNHQIDLPAYPYKYAKPSWIQRFINRKFISYNTFVILITSMFSLSAILLIYINA